MFYPFLKLKTQNKVKYTFKEIHRHALNLEKKEIKLGKNNKHKTQGDSYCGERDPGKGDGRQTVVRLGNFQYPIFCF